MVLIVSVPFFLVNFFPGYCNKEIRILQVSEVQFYKTLPKL